MDLFIIPAIILQTRKKEAANIWLQMALLLAAKWSSPKGRMQTGCKLAAFANLGNRELHVAAFKGFILAANRCLVTAHAEWAAIGLHLGFLSSGGCSGSDELLEK